MCIEKLSSILKKSIAMYSVLSCINNNWENVAGVLSCGAGTEAAMAVQTASPSPRA